LSFIWPPLRWKINIPEAGLKMGIILGIEAKKGRPVPQQTQLFSPTQPISAFSGQTRQYFFGPLSVKPIIRRKCSS
jgi:hypothetical protein